MSLRFSVRVVFKGVWRDLKNYSRYKLALFGWFLGIVVNLFAISLVNTIFDYDALTSEVTGLGTTEMLAFLAGSFALNMFANVGIWAPLNQIERDINYGTLESVFVSPTSRISYLLSPLLSESIIALLFFTPAYILALAVSNNLLNFYVIATTLIISFLTLLSVIAFGIFFAMIALLIRQSSSIAIFFSMIFMFLCGFYVPVQAFETIHSVGGKILKYFAMIFPYTYCYDLMHFFTFGDNFIPLLPIWLEFIILIGESILLLIIAYILLKSVEKKAKKAGLSIL
ncbi:MAG: ABC transporter permease [Asgard group archaeon]|nr:ABC transporter permease [Asgard group archaeon]